MGRPPQGGFGEQLNLIHGDEGARARCWRSLLSRRRLRRCWPSILGPSRCGRWDRQ